MTVQSEIDSVNYTLTGVLTPLPVTFRFLEDGDLKVVFTPISTGVSTELVLNSQYTVFGARTQGGGTVTLLIPTAAGDQVVIDRGNMNRTQLIDYRANDPFPEEDAEDGLDRLTMLLQQTYIGLGRSIKYRDGLYPLPSVFMPDPEPSRIIGWNVAGDALRNVDITGPGDLTLRADLADPTGGANLVAFKQAGTGAVTRTVEGKLRESVSVKDFGAVGDGTTDDTTSVANAVTYALQNNVRRLRVPAGVYKLTAPITVPGSLWIEGDGVEPYEGFNAGPGPNPRGGGSWFYLAHSGKGFTLKAPTVGASASTITISGIGTYRDHTVGAPGVAFTPTVYDYDFTIDDADAVFDDVVLLSAYNGIQVLNGNAGRFTARNLRGQPLNIGIMIDQAYDVVRLTDVHWWVFWSQSTDVAKYMLSNSRGIVSARNDNPLIVNYFCIFYKIGLHIIGNGFGTTGKLKLVNADLDRGQFGIYVEPTAVGHTGDYVNVTAQGEVGALATFVGNNSGVVVAGSVCRMNFTGLDLAEHRGSCLSIPGANNELNVSKSTVVNWNQSGLGFNAFDADATSSLKIADRPKVSAGFGGAIYGGAGTITAPLGDGSSTANTDASGDVTITHNCGITPRRVFIQHSGSVGLMCTVRARGATTFIVRFFDATGAPWVSGAAPFDWRAQY